MPEGIGTDYKNRYVTTGELADKLDRVPTRWEMRAMVTVGSLANAGLFIGLIYALRPTVVSTALQAVIGFFS